MATNVRNGVAKPSTKAPRRHAHFWAALNDWWRSYLADKGRRPVTTEVQVWFTENADGVWGDAKPSWKEARIHAKCLRSTEQVKNYFREYRARAKGVEYKEDIRKDSQHDIKVEFQEGQPLAGHRLASTSDNPPGSPGDASGPSSSDFALEPLPYSFPDKAPDLAAISVPPLGNPMTVTTGNGLPPTWQQRSASERFPPPSVRAQPGQEQHQHWDRSRSSIIFQPPSSAPHSKKAVSPFILIESKKEGEPASGSLLMPGSPMASLSMAAKAQSFSCSSKRRHTNDDAFPPNPSSPSFLRHAASFSHGSFNPTQVPPMYTPTLAYGVPVDNTPSCRLPEASAQKQEEGSFYVRPAPPSNPQTFRYPVSTGQRPPKAQGGCELHAPGWDRAPFTQLGAEEHDAQPQPQQLLMGSMDRQLVEDIARDAAVRSSMIEQAAAAGGSRLREQQQQRSSSVMPLPASQACSDGGFGGHAYAAPAMQQPATDPADDADIADFWDLADKDQASEAADIGDTCELLSCPQFQGLPDPCQPSPRNQQAQHQQGLRQGAAWRGRPQVQQYPPSLARPYAGVSDPGGICRLRAVSYPMAGMYPPLAPNLSAQALGRPAASSRLDPAYHTRAPAGKVQSAARPAASQQHSLLHPASAQQQSQSQAHARSHQHVGLAHPFTTCTDRGGRPSESSSVDCWSGKNPNHNQNQNQPPPAAAFQQQQQQQLLPPPGHSNSNPSGSSSSPLVSASRQEGIPFAGVQHELKLEAGHLAKADSLGLPFQALRVHSAALAPIMDQGNAGQPWSQQEWSHMEWEGRYEHNQGLEGPAAPL